MDITQRELKVLQDILLHAVDADRLCAAHRARIDELLEPDAVNDHEARFALLTRRGRGSLRDRITEYVLEATDLCALLAPAALARARELAHSLPPGGEEKLVELPPAERRSLLEPIFAAAGVIERLRDVGDLSG